MIFYFLFFAPPWKYGLLVVNYFDRLISLFSLNYELFIEFCTAKISWIWSLNMVSANITLFVIDSWHIGLV